MNKNDKIFKIFSIVPNDIDLYNQAFTHASYTNEHHESVSYDRLEFLGDSILDMTIAIMAYKKYPDFNSGNLSKVRSILVSGKSLSYLSEEIYHFDKCVRYSQGEKNNIRFHHHINEDVFEAFIGALYLDQGYEVTFNIVKNIFESKLDNAVSELSSYDPKTTLQELVSSNIDYQVIETNNLNSDDVYYIVEAKVANVVLGKGKGHNIQEAEMNAAKDALIKKVGK